MNVEDRRAAEDVIADVEETVARIQRMVIRLTAYTDRLEAARLQHGEGPRTA